MKILRWEISRMGLHIAVHRWKKRLKRVRSRRYRQMKLPRPRFIINMSNYCNLKCFSCSSLCDKPFNNPYRDKPRIQSLENIENFARAIEGWEKERYVRLSGGEPMMCGADHLHKTADILHKYGRFVSLLTNCYRFEDVDPFRFDQVILDDHTPINKELLEKGVKRMERFRYDTWEVWDSTRHRDLELQRQGRKGDLSKGLRCLAWMDTIALWRDVVYPCCNMYYLEGWTRSDRISRALRKAGWTVENPELLNTLINWRETIPGEAIKTCLLSCWTGGPIKWVDVTTDSLST